jgi:hypothetical protein
MEDKLYNIAKEYHNKCDKFDDQYCKAKNKYWESIPITWVERSLVNNHARHQLKKAYETWKIYWYEANIIFKAIQNYVW